MSPVGLGTRNDCAAEDQSQFIWQTLQDGPLNQNPIVHNGFSLPNGHFSPLALSTVRRCLFTPTTRRYEIRLSVISEDGPDLKVQRQTKSTY